MVFLANANKCQHGNMDATKPAFIFAMQILSFSQSAEQYLFLSCRSTLPAFPSLDYEKNVLKKNQVQTIDCCGLVRCLNLVVLMN